MRPEWFESLDSMQENTMGQIVQGHDFDQQVVNSFPRGMMEMLRALFYYNVTGPQVGIQFLWLPGYDWEMTVTEAPDTPDSPSAISVLIRYRYGRDPHPSTLK
jgi:hypothetical protein